MEELMNESEKRKSAFPLTAVAILLAFMMGLTFGNIKKDVNLKSRDTSQESLIVTDTADPKSTVNSDMDIQATTSDSTGEYYPMYRTPTGRKYHFNPSCAGENRIETDYDEALSLGLTPCKKCADG